MNSSNQIHTPSRGVYGFQSKACGGLDGNGTVLSTRPLSEVSRFPVHACFGAVSLAPRRVRRTHSTFTRTVTGGLLGALITVCSGVAGSNTDDTVNLRIATQNVRNLPDSGFDSRAPRILEVLGEFDLILLQEDFDPGSLFDRWSGWGARGPGPTFRLAYVLTPVIRLLGQHAPYGSGLSILAAELTPEQPITGASVIVREAYGNCSGIFGDSLDCWANKGLLGVRLSLSNDAEIDVYTTHLEANGSAASRTVRQAQLSTLTSFIDNVSSQRAVLVAGDFNSPPTRPEDYAMLVEAMRELGLSDTEARALNPRSAPCQVIRMFYRDGAGVYLKVDDAGEIPASIPQSDPQGMNYCSGARRQRGLSDHPALGLRLAVRRCPQAAPLEAAC